MNEFSFPALGTAGARYQTRENLVTEVQRVIAQEASARASGDAALQTLIDALSTGLTPRGNWDASSGAFPTGPVAVGDFWIVSTGGTVDGVTFAATDRLWSLGTGGLTYAGNWVKADYSDVLEGVGAASVTPTSGAADTLSNHLARIAQVPPRPIRFETGGDDDALREAVAAGSKYLAFPMMARNAAGRLAAVYWHGTAHSPNVEGGDEKGQFDVILSDDGGATWTTPAAIYGNVTAGDPEYAYYAAMGTDRAGRFALVLCIYDGVSAVIPHITRSVDGVTWSTPAALTVTGTVLVPLPFGTISLLPSGRMLVPAYRGDFNFAAIIDDDVSETTLDCARVVIESSSPAYSEMALCPISEREWLAFLRLDGATNSIPTYRTVDGGTNWTSLGDTGLPVSGGYVIQHAFPFEIGAMTHVGLLVGVRESVSSPAEGAPGVMLAVTAHKDMIASGDPKFLRRHFWPLADDDAVRDAYVGGVYDPVTCSLGIVTHEELTDLTSRILVGAVNIGSAMNGQPEQVRRAWTPVLVGATVPGVNVYAAQTGTYATSGDWVDITFRVDVDSGNLLSEGNLSISGFPFAFASGQEFAVTTANILTTGTNSVILRGTTDATTAALLERDGLSNLIHSEVDGNLSLRAAFRYRRAVLGGEV